MKSVFYGSIWLTLLCAITASAQSFSVLHSFINPDETPYAPLVQGPDGTLYGTASSGGTEGYGAVFKVKPDGTGFTNLYNFEADVDGGNPNAGLVLSGGVLFGTTTSAGEGGNGTIFVVGTNGAGFNVLWNFSAGETNLVDESLTNADGADSEAGLVLSGSTLFGTTAGGGIWGNGVVFTLNTNGNDFVARSFSDGDTNAAGVWTNVDGANPQATLVLAGTNLFGTAYFGGTNGNGTLFKLGTNIAGFSVIKVFSKTDANGANSDGANPYASLLLSGTTLYGTAEGGGLEGDGTVFALNTNGAGYTTLKTFSATDENTGTNTDGAYPDGAMVLAWTNLFGTTYGGGFEGNGNVFLVNTNGATKGFSNLHNFAGGTDGANPAAALWLSGSTLFGSASAGGNWGAGTLFSLNTNGSSFTDFYDFYATDGVAPLGGLILSGSTYYGMTYAGGTANNGMVFKMNTNGTAFTVLKSFSAVDSDTGTNTDGANPQGNLVLSGSVLFGTATGGGTGANGTVFVVGTNGGFNVLWNFTAGDTNVDGTFTNEDGMDPEAGLALSAGRLYGTTYGGGVWGNGVVFALNTNGSSFLARSFSDGDTNSDGNFTNADGANPEAGVVLAGTNLYGATYAGGAKGNGTLFKLGTNIAGFSVLKTFAITDPNTGTNNDGANPYADLILSGTTLYGTAENGGTGADGTVFAVGTNGLGYTVLKNFSATDPYYGTNTDGANPDGGVLLSSNLLFGTTTSGGYWGGGTMFEVNTNASAFANLHNFDYYTEGDSPIADLVMAGNVLASTTSEGGIYGGGTVFALDTTVTSPLLGVAESSTGVNVMWPWPSVGFILEQNTNLVKTNWINFPGTITDDGIIKSATVNPPTGTLFFRLYHP